jgi:nicotinate-nucleotide adenylyltransferase
MRTGVFGGTFDPIHLGHLILAEQCREKGRLDQVLFVPTAQPPHKPQPRVSFAQRVEMLQLAISGNSAFQIDTIEGERAGTSYTADTLEEMRRRRPGDELFLIIGADSLRDLPLWYQPERIVRAASLLVVTRPDWPAPALAALRAGLPDDVPLRCEVIEAPLIGIASRALRRQLAEKRSVRYQVPRAVEAYIQDKSLYQQPV